MNRYLFAFWLLLSIGNLSAGQFDLANYMQAPIEDVHFSKKSSKHRAPEQTPPSGPDNLAPELELRSKALSSVGNHTNETVNLEGLPSGFVGHVNVISGDYFDHQVDLIIPSIEPLILQRTYMSSGIHASSSKDLFSSCWTLNHGGSIETSPKNVVVSEGGSTTAEFGTLNNQTYRIRRGILGRGLTNCASGELSGRTNIKNHILSFNWGPLEAGLKMGSGKYCCFSKRGPNQYDLAFCRESNGNHIGYGYDQSRRLTHIETRGVYHNPMGIVNIYYGEFVNQKKVKAYAGDGRQVVYQFFRKKKKDPYQLAYVERPNAPKESFYYQGEQMVRKERPEGRFEEIEYYHANHNDVGGVDVKLDDGDYRIRRVKCLKAPVGPDTTPILTHRFFYHQVRSPKGVLSVGCTGVQDAYGNATNYVYNGKHQLTAIARLIGNSVYSADRYHWGETYTSDESNLITSYFEDASGVRFCRYFKYDANGNVIQEHLVGNLTGKSSPTIVLNGEIPTDFSSQYQKNYTYSNDGYNLKLQESNGRHKICYYYTPNTDLLIARLTYDSMDNLLLREFFDYDANGTVIREVIDDGTSLNSSDLTGVTERRIKVVTPRLESPIGMPHIIEQKYLDLNTGEEKLLSKVINQHDLSGKLLRQFTIDENGQDTGCTAYEYDEKGNLTKQIDPLGREVVYRYDQNGNLTFKQGPRFDFYTEYTYDFSNRLIREEDIHNSGVRLATHHRYNLLSQRISTMDMYGHETFYAYDPYGRVIEIRHPLTPDQNGQLFQSIEKIEYDSMGNQIVKIDGNGNRTQASYTIRGKPYEIRYADGSCERMEYTFDGFLEKTYAKNGVATMFHYDPLGRITCQQTFLPDGVCKTKHMLYNTFHLLEETDEAGVKTTYTYDFAGRLKTVVKGDRKSEVFYDSQGRLSRTHEYFSETDYTVKAQDYDRLGRVIEERVEDFLGNILTRISYEYDIDGNRTIINRYTQAGISQTQTIYGPYHDPNYIYDAEGCTNIHYIYGYINPQGQSVFAKQIVDKLGNSTLLINNARGALSTVIQKNAIGQVLSQQELRYDSSGNLIYRQDIVVTPNAPDRFVITIWEYDAMNREVSRIEAVGTPEQKRTKAEYNANGQLLHIIKPDGVVIHHAYDQEGNLTEFGSHDITYTLEYNLHRQVIRVTDNLGNETLRTYDPNGNLLSETLPGGMKTGYLYDRQGRIVNITLPDLSKIEYVFDALYLKEVHRGNYVHTYDAFDQSGSLTQSTLIGQNGRQTFEYDLMGRLKKADTNHFSESLQFDKMDNLINKEQIDPQGRSFNTYAYNELYQLKMEKGDTNHEYTHDSLFNCVNKDGVSLQINGLNQLLRDAHSIYQYDARGNVIQKGEEIYQYDSFDRLFAVEQNGERTQYTYDELNRRLSKCRMLKQAGEWIVQSTEYFLYQGQNEVGSCNEAGQILELRVLGLGKGAEIGSAVAIELQGNVYAPVHDHNGNVCMLLDLDGNATEVYRYSAFGEEQLFQDNTLNPWRFSSKRTDSETGFVYFGRRYYHPESGRWMTADPLGFTAGPNLYAYVNNNPMTHFDLYGLVDAAGRIGTNRERDYDMRSYRSERTAENAPQENKSERSPNTFVPAEEHIKVGDPYFKDNPRIFDTEGKELEKGEIMYQSGMGNTEQDAREGGEYLSKLSGGYKVTVCHNPTRGGIYDTFRSFLRLFGRKFYTTYQLRNKWTEILMRKGLDTIIIVFCHSEGAIITRNALKGYAYNKNIIVVAIAPAAYTNPKYAKDVTHYCSERDFVPWIDFLNRFRFKENVTILNPHKDANVFDHPFRSPTYKEHIKAELRDYLIGYGDN